MMIITCNRDSVLPEGQQDAHTHSITRTPIAQTNKQRVDCELQPKVHIAAATGYHIPLRSMGITMGNEMEREPMS